MSDWYEVVAVDAPLTQGELIPDCPLLVWSPDQALAADTIIDPDQVRQAGRYLRADVVVMTQACDLEHAKVTDVVLCPHVAISTFRTEWEEAIRKVGHNPTEKAWKRTCHDIAEGHVWNRCFLNTVRLTGSAGSGELRVVEFRQLFTAPRVSGEFVARARPIACSASPTLPRTSLASICPILHACGLAAGGRSRLGKGIAQMIPPEDDPWRIRSLSSRS